MGESEALQPVADLSHFGALGFQEFEACRNRGKKVSRLDSGPVVGPQEMPESHGSRGMAVQAAPLDFVRSFC